jgi:hypothetical protein
MSTVLFSKTFVEKINTIIRRFWWAGVQEENASNPIAYRSWDDICQPKENGGLGIRDLYIVNKTLIIHSAWNVATDKNLFLTVILKAKYYHDKSFWTATNEGPKSIFWSSILQVKKQLCSNSIYQIQAGNSSIWSAPWCPIWESIHDHLLLLVTTNPLLAKVFDLWIPGTNSWNIDLLSNTFSAQANQIITTIQPIPTDQPDILRWMPAKNGIYSTKKIYRHLSSQN